MQPPKPKADILPFPDRPKKSAAGIFTWVLAADYSFVDAVVADCFGLSERDSGGLPIKRFLDCMHPDDAPRVAKAIHDAIITGDPYQEDYRICRADGSVVAVSAFGTCFRDETGEPSHFSGMLVARDVQTGTENDLLEHCLAAYDLAQKSGKHDVVKKLLNIIEALEDHQAVIPLRRSR